MESVPPLPPMALALVNPGAPVSTPAVFAALERADGEPMGPVPEGLGYGGLLRWLEGRANHLAAAAERVEPAIGRALAHLREAPGVNLARLSGSGATCFGVCPDLAAAERACAAVLAAEPRWWARPAVVLP